MESVDDFVKLLNYVREYNSPSKQNVHLQISDSDLINFVPNYRNFSISKKSGGQRLIQAPDKLTKSIQKDLNSIFSAIYEPRSYVTGFVKGKNIVTNAQEHVHRKFVLNVDIKDYFSNIFASRISTKLSRPPYSTNCTIKRKEVIELITNLCCNKGFLPSGSPTSPIISNIVCEELDLQLEKIATLNKCKFTRYADDVSFSSDEDIFDKEFVKNITYALNEQGFEINEKKIRVQGQGYRQEVTGIIVNEKVNISRGFIREIRSMLYNWEVFGYLAASKIFKIHYKINKPKQKNIPLFKNVILGKLQFLKIVRGENDSIVVKYFKKYNELYVSNNTYPSQITEKFIEDNNTSELTSLLFTDSSDFFIKDDGSIGVTKGNVVSTDTNTVQVTNAKNNNDFKTIRDNIRKAKINFFKDIFYFINSDIEGEIKNNIKNYTVKTLNYISKTGSQPRLITNHKGLFRTSASQYFTIVNKEGVVAYTLPLNYNIFYEDKDGSYKLFIDPNKEFSEREYNDIINGFGNKDKSFKHSYSYQQYKKERLDYINLMTVVNNLANSNLTNEDKINKFIELTNINLTNYGVIKNKSENVNNNFVKFNDIIPLPYINYTEDTESGQELINPLIVVQEVEELNTDTNVKSKSLNMSSGDFTKGLSPELRSIIKQKLKAWYDKQMTKENPFDFGNSFHLVALDSITNEPTFVRFENEDITQQVTDNINTLTDEYKTYKTVTWITFDVDDSLKNFKLFFYKNDNNNWGIKISEKTPSRKIKDNVIPAKIEEYFLPIDMSKEPQKSWIKIDKSERIEREILEIPKDINLTEFLLQDLVDTHNNTLKEYQKEQLELTKKLKDATSEERKSIKSTIKLGVLKTKVFENNNQIEPFIKSIEKSLINKSFKMVDNTPASKINNNNGVSSLKNRTKIKADNEFIFKTVCLTVKAKQQLISTTINPIVEPIIEKVKQEPVINEPVIAAINNQVNDNQLDNDFQDIISKFDNLKQLNTEQIKYLESIYEIKLPKISYAPDKTVVALDKDVLKQLNLEKLNSSINTILPMFKIENLNNKKRESMLRRQLNLIEQVYDEIDTVPFTRITTSVENELELSDNFRFIVSYYDNLKQLNTEQLAYLESIYEIKLPKISYAPDGTVVALNKDVLKRLNLEKLNLRNIQFINNIFKSENFNNDILLQKVLTTLNSNKSMMFYEEIDTVPFTRTTTSAESELELSDNFRFIVSYYDNLKQLNIEQIKYLESIYEIKLPKISYAPDKTVVALDKDVLKQLNLEKLNLKSIQFLNNFFSINKINDISKHRRMMVALNTEQQVYDEIDTIPFTRTTTSVENELELSDNFRFIVSYYDNLKQLNTEQLAYLESIYEIKLPKISYTITGEIVALRDEVLKRLNLERLNSVIINILPMFRIENLNDKKRESMLKIKLNLEKQVYDDVADIPF